MRHAQEQKNTDIDRVLQWLGLFALLCNFLPVRESIDI